MYTIAIVYKNQSEPTVLTAPDKMIAKELGEELSLRDDIENVLITLNQSNHYVKSQHIFLKLSFPYLEFDQPPVVETVHTLTPYDWMNN